MNTDYDRLLVAPTSVRSGLVERIDREADRARRGEPAAIRFKLNSIVDEAIIDALYRASGAGVPVDIWVRGICAIRPGVAGLSDNIRVRSVLGRFLEHSRVFSFGAGPTTETWIGSADLMHRNLDRRVEALVHIRSPQHVEELARLLDLGFDPGTSSWHLGPDGEWVRHAYGGDGEPLLDLQAYLIGLHGRRLAAA
jgi:polyphosphate kinase